MTTISSQSIQLNISHALVELYVLDCTQLGGVIHRFTPNTEKTGGPVYWQGQMYIPIPIQSTGWEFKGDGSQSKPQLVVSNVTKALLQEIIDLGDIVGAKITRYRTFSNFLDNGEEPDAGEAYPPDTRYIEQKQSHDNETIVWSLCSVLDRQNLFIPARQVTKKDFPAIGAYRPTRY